MATRNFKITYMDCIISIRQHSSRSGVIFFLLNHKAALVKRSHFHCCHPLLCGPVNLLLLKITILIRRSFITFLLQDSDRHSWIFRNENSCSGPEHQENINLCHKWANTFHKLKNIYLGISLRGVQRWDYCKVSCYLGSLVFKRKKQRPLSRNL